MQLNLRNQIYATKFTQPKLRNRILATKVSNQRTQQMNFCLDVLFLCLSKDNRKGDVAMSKPKEMDDISVIAQKEYLTAYETALLYNLGIHFVRSIMADNRELLISVGANNGRKLINRKKFADYIQIHCKIED